MLYERVLQIYSVLCVFTFKQTSTIRSSVDPWGVVHAQSPYHARWTRLYPGHVTSDLPPEPEEVFMCMLLFLNLVPKHLVSLE